MIQSFKDRFSKKKSNGFKVARTPLQELQRKIIFGLIFVVSVISSFYIGVYWTSEIAHERDALLQSNAKLNELIEQEKVNVTSAKLNAEIADLAVEQVREKNSELLLQIADLERDVTYYQRVMNPIRNDKGLRIDTVEVEPTTDGNRFRLNIVLTQLGRKNSSVIQGSINFSIEGSEQGAKKIYEFEDLRLNKDIASKFRFRYYQEISEEFIVPEYFIPERINVRAISSGSKSMTVDRTEIWPL